MLFGLLHDYVATSYGKHRFDEYIAAQDSRRSTTPAKCILRHFAALPHSYCVCLYLGGTYLLPPKLLTRF